MVRKILHIDMDAFYASIEQQDNPALKGQPVIVGGDAEKRGVVSAASYEARAFGVHSAMPASQARRLCPQGVFLPVRMDRYREVSGQIFEVFQEYTPSDPAPFLGRVFSGCNRMRILVRAGPGDRPGRSKGKSWSEPG